MSVKWTTTVWEHSQHKGSELLVLLALADNAQDETGECYPGIKYLATKTRLSERVVQVNLRRLEDSGEIITKQQGSLYKTNLYRIVLRPKGVTGSGGEKIAPVMPTAPGGDAGNTTPVSSATPKPSVEPSDKPKDIYTREFEEWWEMWPKKGDAKKPAFFSWKKLAWGEREQAKASLPRWLPYYASIENRLIPNATTWLNQARFEVEPPPIERPRQTYQQPSRPVYGNTEAY